MVPRQISASLRDTLNRFPAVALLGPRQVGKITLAHLIGLDALTDVIPLEDLPELF
jgi:predicted AAA+ superfamily ATPase